MVNCDHHALFFLAHDGCGRGLINWPINRANPQKNQYLVSEHCWTRSQPNSPHCRRLPISLTPRSLPRPSTTGPTPRSRSPNLLMSLTKVYSRESKIIEKSTERKE